MVNAAIMILTLGMDQNEYVKAWPRGVATDRMSLSSASAKTYTVDGDSGLIHPALQCPSPNQDSRPGTADPCLIILHGISLPPGEYGGPYIEQLFTNTLNKDEHPYFAEIHQLKVSAHLLVRRDGTVIQYVPFNRRAWHAGESRFRGAPRCNDYSVGIELEGDDMQRYDERQYPVLGGIVVALMKSYPNLNIGSIAGHCDVASGRKTDPGPAFDWLRLYDDVAERFCTD